jgi:hypothetical protein
MGRRLIGGVMSSDFWSEDCPQRGAFLGHAHEPDCIDTHRPSHLSDQCCYCLQRAADWIPPALGWRLGQRPSIAGSERAAARQPWEAWVEAVRQAATDMHAQPRSLLHEPAIASGLLGDGELSERDRRRLEFYVCYLRGWSRGQDGPSALDSH